MMKKIIRYYSKFILILIILFLSSLLFGCEEVITSGSISIVSTPPGAKVYLDGVDTGFVTPVTLNDISTGPHSVKLERYHYKNREEEILVFAGETTPLNWALSWAELETIILQPGPDEGKDADVNSKSSNTNNNSWYVNVGGMVDKTVRSYLQFDLSTIPPEIVVTDAILWLYQFISAGSGDFSIGLYRVTGEWEEETLTWNNQPDSSFEVEDTLIIPYSIYGWRYWHISNLVQGWLEGARENYGMLLKAVNEGLINAGAGFYASETTDASKRPKLEI